jgi:DNA-binding MurR/RpiR family transcriptional regulator
VSLPENPRGETVVDHRHNEAEQEDSANWRRVDHGTRCERVKMQEQKARSAGAPRTLTAPLPKLSRKQKTVAAFVEHNPQFAAFASAAELAQRVDVHPATVVRLAQVLGYRGYPEFQEAIRHRYLASLDAVSIMRERSGDRPGSLLLASIDQDNRNVSATRGSLDLTTMRTVAGLVLDARCTLFIGNGSHGGLGLIFAHLCQFMGLPVEAEIRGGISMAPRIARMGAGDVLIGTSAWWVVQEIRDSFEIARGHEVTTVAIVDSQMSPLASVADHVLVTQTESASFFQSMAGPLALLNALVTEIATVGGDRVRDAMNATTNAYARLDVAWHGIE